MVDNRGDIVGNTIGILCAGGANVSLVNTGRIVSGGDGIYSAFAGDFRLDNRGNIVGDLMGVNLSGSGSIDILNSGSITGTAEYGIYVQSDNGNINITNTGSITASGAVGIGGSTSNGNVALHNQGDISGSNDAVILGTYNGNVNITNTGRITTTSNVTGAGLLALSYNGSISFNNLGYISGGDGIDLIAQNGNITITNTGSIIATATNYISPSVWYGDGIYARATNGNIVLNNQGLISGTLYGVDLDWDSSNVQITNTGSIVASDIPNGIGVYAPTLGNLSLTNLGTISGVTGIVGSAGGAATYVNYGTIVGSGVHPFATPLHAGAAAIYHLGAATLDNWGTIQGDVVFPGAYPHSVVLHSGSTLAGDIVGGSLTDNLTLDGAGTLNSHVIDFDSLTKSGNGLWNLTEDINLGAAPGTSSINSGTLAVNANLTASQAWILPGGTLQGSGTVIGNVHNTGTVGPGNSIGTLNISGNYVQGASGALAIEVDGTGAHDVLAVTGTASLAGRLEVYPMGFIASRSTYSGILTAGGGVTGQFDQALLVSGSPVLSIMPVYNSNSVDLLFNRNYSGVAWGQQRLAVAQVIDGITSLSAVSADLQTILSRLDMSSVSDINLALGQMHPAIYDGLKEASFIQGRYFADASLARLDTLRGAPSTGATQAKSSLSAETGSPGWNPDPLKRVNFFMQGGGEFYDRSSAFERVGYSFTGGSFIGGADYALNPWLTAGLAAGYGGSNLDFDDLGGSEADFDSVYVGGYAGFNYLDYFADLSLGYVFNSYQMHRRMVSTVFNTTAYSSFDGGEFLTKLQVGRRFEVSGLGFTPVVKLEYGNLDRDGFVESGAGGLNLAVRSHSDNSLQSSLGGTLDYRMEFGDWSVTPMVRAFWVHEMLDDNLDYFSTLTGIPGSPLVTTAMGAETDAAKLGGGVTFGFGKNLTAYVAYDAVLVSGYEWHSISGGLKVTF